MSSTRTELWKRILIKYLPFIFNRCPAGNYHYKVDTVCVCECNRCNDRYYGNLYIRYNETWNKFKMGLHD